MVIKPLEEDSTPGTVKPFQVSLVEPVAYQFQLGRFMAATLRVFAKSSSSRSQRRLNRSDTLFQPNIVRQYITNRPGRPSPNGSGRVQRFNLHNLVHGLLQMAVSRTPRRCGPSDRKSGV